MLCIARYLAKSFPFGLKWSQLQTYLMFVVAKLLYILEFPSVNLEETAWGRCDFLLICKMVLLSRFISSVSFQSKSIFCQSGHKRYEWIYHFIQKRKLFKDIFSFFVCISIIIYSLDTLFVGMLVRLQKSWFYMYYSFFVKIHLIYEHLIYNFLSVSSFKQLCYLKKWCHPYLGNFICVMDQKKSF